MPQKFVVDHNGLRNRVVDPNPLQPDVAQVAKLRKLGKGMDIDRQTLLKLIEEEKPCLNE